MVQRLLIRGPMPVESIGPLVDLPPQMGKPGAATLVRFVERRPHLFRLRRFPNSPVALVAVAPGAQAWLAYKRRLLQFIADHGPRVPLEALPCRPPDLPAELQKLDMNALLRTYMHSECWTLAGAHMYSERGLRTVELRPFVLPPGPSGRGAPGAPVFPPFCCTFHGTLASCRMEDRCPCSHAKERAWH